MNPFDLAGPQFLVFYALLAVGVHLAFRPLARWLLSRGDAQPPSAAALQNLDPYLIAYLRGQANETARVAIVSLLDRGLLRADKEKIVALAGAVSRVRRPLERAIVQTFAGATSASKIFRDSAFRDACEGLAAELRRVHFLPSNWAWLGTTFLRLAFIALLAEISATKVSLAFARGHHNVTFLILMTIVACAVMLFRKGIVRTSLGERALKQLRDTFTPLRERADGIRTGGASTEMVLLAAVFGLAALPMESQAQAQLLFPTALKSAASSSGSCGSSCGSSSCGSGSSSCGSSSCGGGGCGGGCGGCGG